MADLWQEYAYRTLVHCSAEEYEAERAQKQEWFLLFHGLEQTIKAQAEERAAGQAQAQKGGRGG